MKVCMLTSSFPRHDGDFAGNFIYGPAQKLVTEGVSVIVVAPADAGTSYKQTMNGILVHRFRYMPALKQQRLAYRDGGLSVTLKRGWSTRLQLLPFTSAFWAAAISPCRDADVIHAHWTLAGIVSLAAGLLQNKPTILSLWGADINLARGRVLSWVNRCVFQNVDRITVVSTDLRERVLALGLPDKKIVLLPNSVDETRFRPVDRAAARQRLGLPHDFPLILYVGSLIERKGVRDLVQAMSEIDSEMPKAQLFLVGEGHLRKDLETQVQTLELGSNVSFAGARPSHEVPYWMNAADVLVLPSYSEGRPTVVLEAMACRTAVVASDIGGNRELVVPQETGLLARAGDPGDIADKLVMALRDDGLRDRLSRGGRRIVLERGFTWQGNARRLLNIYTETVGL
ncbi:MAG: glycosyltransferase [bacterium]